MKNDYISFRNPFKAVVSALALLFLSGYGIFFLLRKRLLAGIVFCGLAVIFIIVFISLSAYTTINKDGITQRIFGIRKNFIRWSDVREVGIIGSKVFNNNPEKAGTLYYYFSPRILSEQDRFNLMVKGIPKDIILTLYNESKIERIQYLWNSPITLYNVGNLEL